jgi:hypothetical protein
MCIKDLVQSGHMDAKTVIVGRNAVRTAHGAGWPWSVEMAIGFIACRTRIVDRTLSETLLVLYVIIVVAVVAAKLWLDFCHSE